MSLPALLIGLLGQAVLALFLFMIVAFSAGGTANTRTLTETELAVLTASAWVLPGLCVVVGAALVVLYRSGAGPVWHTLHLVPVAAAVIYLLYTASLLRA